MIRTVTGRLRGVETGRESVAAVELPGSGIELEVLIPKYLAEKLAEKPESGPSGGAISLHSRVVLESTTQGASFVPRLIGFESAKDRAFFEVLTTVKGLGTRRGLRAMTVSPADIARAIAGGDTKALEKLPEIGKRLAQTIVAELSGKVDGYLDGSEIAALDRGATPGREVKKREPIVEEAIEALMALGDARADAETKIDKALGSRAGGFERADDLVAAAFGR